MRVRRHSSGREESLAPITVGDRFPDFELLDYKGQPWRLAEHRGRPVVVILHRHLA